MAKPNKEAAIAELEEKFRTSSALLLTEYRGLTVSQMTDLRNALRAHATYSVTKNTLARIAAKNAGMDYLVDELKGPTAIVFVSGEAVDAAKALRDFAKENEKLVIKAGAMDGKLLDADGVKALADLDSREVTLAKLAGAFIAKQSQAAALFAAPATKMVRTIDALREKQEKAA
ncbi:50S ribosomal protein L10 [Nanchangia anserum]|uniref:Large ribosomal subunit protein uL10 n=1 Tax=Nanchangia anserum TaxID=2692125 RepID=A0A8I0GC17_9ACTO|nr:50S ribosomal protein L10 [Nanchangia anserum]MBD3689246.1 50S ribosomal protein L10 [Nanchangia anserum]QOX81469.1 50S ribosomal protein L10 [Nanchangia anserum]